jgi:hypothetical protein
MAAKKDFNRYAKEKRLTAYLSCTQCNGAPRTRQCNLQGLIFNLCEDCDEIIGEYRKEGEAIRITQKSQASNSFNDPNFRKEVITETLPGLEGLIFQ